MHVTKGYPCLRYELGQVPVYSTGRLSLKTYALRPGRKTTIQKGQQANSMK